MGPSKVDIWNMALGHVKARQVSDPDEASVQANVCRTFWEGDLRATLRSNKWGFAKVVEALAVLATFTPYGYEYAYAYPANALAFWLIYNDATLDKGKGEDFDYQFDKTNNQKVICSDCAEAYGEYTIYVEDTTLFDADFVEALALKLAASIAPQLSADDNLAANLIKLYNNKISDAQRMSSYENKRKPLQSSKFTDARA